MTVKRDDYYDIVIVGGGAGGLAGGVAALKADRALKLKVVERQARVGKKLLATGNGRCNYTNVNLRGENYFGDRPQALAALTKFPPESNIEFLGELGIYPRYEGEGRVYPYSNQAAAVVDALRFALVHSGGEITVDSQVEAIRKTREGFLVTTTAGEVCCKAVILACGGGAAPDLGGCFLGYKLAASLGHRVVEPEPVLTPLKTDNSFTKPLKGLKFSGEITLFQSGRYLGASRGEVLFTEYGLSGIAAMSLSCYLPGQALGGLTLSLDFFPDLPWQELLLILQQRRENLGYLTLENYFTGLVNKKVGQQLLKRILKRQLSQEVQGLTDEELKRLAKGLKGFTLEVTGNNGWKQAQATAGGVPMDEVDPETMASKKCRGLFFAGEILNVYGDCGGYNLQWAWSTGRLAAISALESLKEVRC